MLGATRRHPAGEGGKEKKAPAQEAETWGTQMLRMISAAAKTLSVLEWIKDGVLVGFVFL